jgi:hypothetical protein
MLTSFLLSGVMGCATMPAPVAVSNVPPPAPPPVIAVAGPPEPPEVPDELGRNPVTTIDTAVAQARVGPVASRFERGLYRYRFRPFSVYVLWTTVDHDTRILLAPGERFFYAGVADKTRWILDITKVGEGDTEYALLILQPKEPKLRTMLTITTSWGLYQLEVIAKANTYMPAVAWSHPPPRVIERPVVATPASDRYTMQVFAEAASPWIPRRIWHTTAGKTYMELGPETSVTELPVVYKRGTDGLLMRMNHRLTGAIPPTLEMDGLGREWQLQTSTEAVGQVVKVSRVQEDN